MKLQMIQDGTGKTAGVFIPIKEWNLIKKKHKDLASLENDEPSKEQLLNEIKQAILELQLIEKGKLKSRPIKELLDEL